MKKSKSRHRRKHQPRIRSIRDYISTIYIYNATSAIYWKRHGLQRLEMQMQERRLSGVL